jgi:hypothetical protein
MKLNLRNANISVGVAAVILFSGVYVFRDASDEVLQTVLAISWVGAFGTFAFLNARDERRGKRSQ